MRGLSPRATLPANAGPVPLQVGLRGELVGVGRRVLRAESEWDLDGNRVESESYMFIEMSTGNIRPTLR